VLGLTIGTGVDDRGVNVTTIGTPAKTLIEHRNGSTWTSVPSPTVNGASRLTAAAAVPGGGVWATGYSGTSGSFNPLALKTGG